MALSPIYYARGDSNSANNAELNVRNESQYPVTPIQFTSGTSGDLLLDFVPDGGDANTLPEFDPDTQVIIGGQTYSFVFLKSGTLDPARVPAALANDPVYVIKVDMNNDGDVDDAGDVQIFFTTSPDGTLENISDISNGALRIGSIDLTPPPDPVCFCAGTLIGTPSGQRKVETLSAGDLVLTANGAAKQVIWVGSTQISEASLRENPHLRPIVISAGSLGHAAPAADLLVSPQHRVMIQNAACGLLFGEEAVLVPAKFLVGTLAEVAKVAGDVEYFHILLQDHDMVLSNGLPTESFQPARRTMDVMGDAARSTLEAVLVALGEDQMLARKDGLRSLRKHEARVLMHLLKGRAGTESKARSSAERTYH